MEKLRIFCPCLGQIRFAVPAHWVVPAHWDNTNLFSFEDRWVYDREGGILLPEQRYRYSFIHVRGPCLEFWMEGGATPRWKYVQDAWQYQWEKGTGLYWQLTELECKTPEDDPQITFEFFDR